jgi:hypothetical protein
MEKLSAKSLNAFIEENIPDFHKSRADSVAKLPLRDLLLRKNPYLFKAKHLEAAGDFVRALVDAYLSSQEETIFGGFLERLAIYVCSCTLGGRKSATEGIDMEFDRDGVLFLFSIKSGPKWGNSAQIAKMRDHFRKAKITLSTNSKGLRIEAINGCCYGRDNQPEKGDYRKLCGERFWEFITGMPTLYTDIIEPLGHRASECNKAFEIEKAKLLNRLTTEFTAEFCTPDFAIDWPKIVRFNSAIDPPLRPRRKKAF